MVLYMSQIYQCSTYSLKSDPKLFFLCRCKLPIQMLVFVQTLLYHPIPVDPANEEAGKMYVRSTYEYFSRININPFYEHAASSETRSKGHQKLQNTAIGKEEDGVVSYQKGGKSCKKYHRTFAGEPRTILYQTGAQGCQEIGNDVKGDKNESIVGAKGSRCKEAQKRIAGDEKSSDASSEVGVPGYELSHETVAHNGHAYEMFSEPDALGFNEETTDIGSKETNSDSLESDTDSSEEHSQGTSEAKAA